MTICRRNLSLRSSGLVLLKCRYMQSPGRLLKYSAFPPCDEVILDSREVPVRHPRILDSANS